MSPVMEPMTFDELSELYRVEMKSSAITPARRDLFRAMANLLTSLRQEYDRQMAIDPESVMCEGAEQRRKKAERLVKDIVHIRTQKICHMAIRGAMGGKNTIEVLTDEEREYYDKVLELSKRHMSETDRLRGRLNTVDTRIDEIPPAPRREAEPPRTEPPEQETEQEVPPEMFDDSPDDFADEPIPDEFMEESFDETSAPAPAADRAVPVEESIPVPTKAEGQESALDADGDLKPVLIRVLEDLPEFAGPDRDYKLSKEDIVTLPKVLADVLTNSGKAYAVRPTP